MTELTEGRVKRLKVSFELYKRMTSRMQPTIIFSKNNNPLNVATGHLQRICISLMCCNEEPLLPALKNPYEKVPVVVV